MSSPGITDQYSYRGDEYMTLEKDAEIIAQNIIKPMTVWCPFNSSDSVWVPVLKRHGHKVVTTDTDFFETEIPVDVDCIIDNPPFSKKKEVLKRIDDLGLKYALILPFLFLNDGLPFDYGNQYILFRKRMRFKQNGEVLSQPRTNCFVLSNGILQHDFTIIR